MEQSTEIKNLAKALTVFAVKMETVSFDSSNPFFKSKYASLTTLVEHARTVLSECGLAVSQLTEGEGSVTTILMHESGEWMRSNLKLTPVKNDPQGLGSAITYARRYAYASILGLVADKDDDANEATGLNKKEATPLPSPKTLTLLDRVEGTGLSKFGDTDKFKLWRVDHSLVEDLSKATTGQLNTVLEFLRDKK